MSVYKHKGSPFYHFDFQLKGNRFHGSTGCTNKREADEFERDERERAKREIRQSPTVSTQLDYVAGRYWSEIGQHHAGADTTWRDIERLIGYFGAAKLLTEIGDDDVAKLVAWRRGHRVKDHRKRIPKDAPPLPLVSNATVNRSTTEVLKKLFTRAKAWGIRFDRAGLETALASGAAGTRTRVAWRRGRSTRQCDPGRLPANPGVHGHIRSADERMSFALVRGELGRPQDRKTGQRRQASDGADHPGRPADLMALARSSRNNGVHLYRQTNAESPKSGQG